MLNKALWIFVFVCVLLSSGVPSTSEEDATSPETLVIKARKSHEIWADGTPSVVMRAGIQVTNAKSALAPGQYTVTWVSPLRWRDELRFANYERLRVHDAKGYWQKSGLNFQPEIIFQLDTLLDFKTVPKIGAKQVLGKLKSRDKDVVGQRCTGVKWTTGTERILCFDEASGDLLCVEYPRIENQTPPDISRIEYSAFKNVGEKRVPFEIRAFRDRKIVATVKILDITPLAEENPAQFVAPTNSEYWVQCDDMQEEESAGQVHPPTYPPNARLNGEQGRIVFYAVIEADGTLSHLRVIQPATPALESAATIAIRQWHYKPATCGSTPIRVETSISMDFWLQR